LPFILKLGVPLAALFWVYVVLGRIRRRLDVAVNPEQDIDADPVG
jgi:hypothetical protein